MTPKNIDLNLMMVVLANVAIITAWLAASCFLFYISHPVAGGFCLVGPLFTCINYRIHS